jgi:hypothetical protein
MKAAVISKNKNFIIWLGCVSMVTIALVFVHNQDIAELRAEQQVTDNNLNAIDTRNINCLQNMYQLP